MIRTLALSLSIFLTACGGGGGSDAPEAPQKAACAPVKIATFGDSTMAYATIAVTGATVENRAVSGTAAFQLLAGTDTKNAAWTKHLATNKPDVVLINHAINDMALGRTLEQYRSDLEELVTTAQAAGARVVLQTPVPQTLTAPYGQAWRVEAIRSYAAVMRDVAKVRATGLAEVSTFVEGIAGYETLVFDGVHPNPALTAQIYDGPVRAALAAQVAAACR